MLAALLNLGFAGGGTAEEESVTKGGFGSFDRKFLRRLQIQQGIRKDDDEVVALILGLMNRRQ